MFDPLPKGFGYLALCEGCGPTIVDDRGHCRGDCLCGHAAIPPERREVYESAQRWVDRRSGPLGPLLRLWDRYMGTPWEPGYRHFPGHWLWYLIELYRSLRDDRPMMRVVEFEDGTFEVVGEGEGFLPHCKCVLAPEVENGLDF
jgi:hypothetical protein